jgi:predicted nucleic acid-binding OB-fold protein
MSLTQDDLQAIRSIVKQEVRDEVETVVRTIVHDEVQSVVGTGLRTVVREEIQKAMEPLEGRLLALEMTLKRFTI